MPRKSSDLSDNDFRDLPPSKSQLKREMQALQQLGETLIAMTATERARFPLSDDLLAAIDETARIRSHEGRRRHMQYVGKLMRKEDLDAINACFDAIEDEQAQRDHAFQRLEKWRERLIDGGDADIEAFLKAYPDADRQVLRQLVRNAVRERQKEAGTASARKLFKHLRDSADL